MSALKVIEKSRGRFFGLHTIAGEKINARFVGESNNYIRVFDRNARQERKFAKTSVRSVTYGGQTFV